MRALIASIFAIATLAGGPGAVAQVKVRTETIRPPTAAVTPPSANQFVPPAADTGAGIRPGEPPAPAAPKGAGGEFATDFARLPAARRDGCLRRYPRRAARTGWRLGA